MLTLSGRRSRRGRPCVVRIGLHRCFSPSLCMSKCLQPASRPCEVIAGMMHRRHADLNKGGVSLSIGWHAAHAAAVGLGRCHRPFMMSALSGGDLALCPAGDAAADAAAACILCACAAHQKATKPGPACTQPMRRTRRVISLNLA